MKIDIPGNSQYRYGRLKSAVNLSEQPRAYFLVQPRSLRFQDTSRQVGEEMESVNT